MTGFTAIALSDAKRRLLFLKHMLLHLYFFDKLKSRRQVPPALDYLAFRQLSSKSETKSHPLWGWAAKGDTKKHQSSTIRMFRPIAQKKAIEMANQTNSLSHIKWMGKYHIVTVPKIQEKNRLQSIPSKLAGNYKAVM